MAPGRQKRGEQDHEIFPQIRNPATLTAVDVFATVAIGNETFEVILQVDEDGDYGLGNPSELSCEDVYERMMKALGLMIPDEVDTRADWVLDKSGALSEVIAAAQEAADGYKAQFAG